MIPRSTEHGSNASLTGNGKPVRPAQNSNEHSDQHSPESHSPTHARQTIQWHVTWIMMVLSGVIASLTIAFFSFYGISSFEQRQTQNLQTLVNILGDNAKAIFVFGDRVAADAFLSTLANDSSIIEAVMIDNDGAVIGAYRSQPDLPPLALPATIPSTTEMVTRDGHTTWIHPIVQKQVLLGAIIINSNDDELQAFLRQLWGVTGLMFVLILGVSFLLSRYLQRVISRPIVELDHAAKDISRHQDFSVHVSVKGQKEVASLYESFNFLLEQIRERDRQRDQREQMLQLKEQRYRLVTDNVPIMIALINPSHEYVLVNPAYAQFFGHPHETFANRHLREIHGAPAYDDMAQELKRVCYGHRVEFSKPIQCANAQERLVDGLYVPVFSDDGRPQGVYVFLEDITDRKRAEDAVRDSEQRYRTIVENAYDLIIETDPAGNCTYVSPNCKDVLGYDAQEWHGRAFFDLLHADDGPALSAEFQANILSLRTTDMVCRMQRKDSEWRTFESHIRPLRTAEGTVVAIIVSRDITERKQLEEEYLRSSKLESVGLLAGGIAHDFNNILMSVLGNIEVAKFRGDKAPADIAQPLIARLTIAEKACLRAGDLTKQLLTFAKGGVPIKSTASISTIIQDTVEFALRGSSIKCDLSLPEDLWAGDVDEGQISQVLQNLIINADQAMPEGGTIMVGARNVTLRPSTTLPLITGRYVEITIADQGIGITDEHLSKIFDPYFTTKHMGSGLGLSTSYSIMKNHGGHIDVTSAAGVGTTFTLLLPAASTPYIPPSTTTDHLIHGPGKILIMDDEDDIRDVLAVMLKDLGFTVDAVSDGEEAIRQFIQAHTGNAPYDAAILDLTIPGGMGGKEAYRHIREYQQDAKVFASSGYSNDPVIANSTQYGFAGFIPKPYNIRVLSRMLQQSLSTP